MAHTRVVAGGSTTLTKRFVSRWARAYEQSMGSVEPWLFAAVGPAARARRFYEPDEFAQVAAWKTSRSKPRIALNSQDDVRDVTRLAFAAPERLQHRILTLLDGVRTPTATALLAVAFPDRHTILDVRTTEALTRLGSWDGSGGYRAYLDVCRRLADTVSVDLRTLDRALWQWSKDGYSP
jgi:hypothetical protein